MVVICFLDGFFFTISIFYFVFFCLSSYLLVFMDEHSIEDRFFFLHVLTYMDENKKMISLHE